MILPPSRLDSAPSIEQLQLAKEAHMEYKRIYVGGKFAYWKLYHSKKPRDCGC